ncbi:unnamed protein product [Rotaria sp. Silwood1]|nr:unnamed protein product [Rotaria sp. Silwood1]CAF1648845.1 unnamed protein product [Rotaria sp. Silwood1]
MNQSNISVLDLPDEILLIILKKLDNMDVLYSLLDVDNRQLNIIAQENIFTNTLNFVLTTFTNDISSMSDAIIDRFCKNILPRIHYNVKSLIVDSLSMERILLAVDYPNLTELKLFNFNGKIASCYFTDEGPFKHTFLRQITDLILVFENYIHKTLGHYSTDLCEYIMKFFRNLKHLSFIGSSRFSFPTLLYRNLSSTTFSSSILNKLRIRVVKYADCLAILDGRFKQLRSLIVDIIYMTYHSSNVYNMDDLPNLKCFSLTTTSDCCIDTYNHISLLVRRMINLEELTLYLTICMGTAFIDGTNIYNEILVHVPQLHIFNFCICIGTMKSLVYQLSKYDIQNTFPKTIYKEVDCMVQYKYRYAICHVFSLPFMFDYIGCIGNTFPNVIFNHVRRLMISDSVPFKHEFFIRIAWSFPLLEHLRVINMESQSLLSNKLKSNDNQLDSIVKYPHLTWLEFDFVDIDYVEQFLNETKIHLPCLRKLTVNYRYLSIVTKNFTRYITRRNCMKVNELDIGQEIIQRSKDFDVYFPVLQTCVCFD